MDVEALPPDPNPPDAPAAPGERRETFPLPRILQIVRDHDAYMQDHRDEMGLTAAICETRFWEFYIGFGKRQGITNTPLQRDGAQIEVNRLRKMIRTYLGALYPRTSRAVCEADPHGRGDAQITQATLNAWWKKPYAYPTVDHVLQMVLTLPGGAGFKAGYDPGTGSPLERTWLRPIPPWELVLDRDAPSWEDERYRGHVYQAPIEEVYERYPHLRGCLHGGRRTDFFDQPEQGNPDPLRANATPGEHGEFVRVLEFLNLRDTFLSEGGEFYRGRLEVYVLDQGEYSKRPVVVTPLPFQDADGRDLPNIEPLIFEHEIGYPFRPIPPARAAIPQQVELNKMRTAAAGDVRRNTRKYAYTDGAIQQDQIDLLNNGVDGQGVKVNPGHDPNKVIFPIPHQPIPADTIAYMARAEADLDRQLGPSQNAQGQLSSGNTAYEVQTVQLYAEEEIKYHALMLTNCLAKVTRLAQAAILAAGQDTGDSEEAADAGAEAPPPESVEGAPAEPRIPPKSMVKRPKIRAFEPFVIMDGEQKLTVTAESLTGDFPITFVDADTTPVNRQTVLQFMTGPGLQQYMELWKVAVQGGPLGLLAKRSMQHLAEAMNLPKDMHPDAMEAVLKREEAEAAKEKAKAPPPRSVMAPAPQAPQPPPQAPPPGEGTAALVDALHNALTALGRLANASPEAKAALTPAGRALLAAIEAAKAGDVDALVDAVLLARDELPPGIAPDVEALLAMLADKLAGEEPTEAPAVSAGPPADPAGSPLADQQMPEIGA